MLATPAAAQAGPSSFTRSGPNLTLVVANCERSTDTTAAVDLARHSRNAAAACLSTDGVPAELTDLIAAFAPDRVMVVGGRAAVPPAVMDELSAAVRSAYWWAVIQRVGGATRAETAAAAARAGLGAPDRVDPGTVVLVVADGWNDADVNTAREFAAGFSDVAIAYYSPVTVASGLSEATSSLIADYRPARVVLAGLADEAGLAAEAAIRGVLNAIGSDVSVERVALATDTPSAIEVAALTGTARTTFEAINRGERRPTAAARSERAPFLVLTEASGIGGVGSTLFTLRADGSDRKLRTVDHNGWKWHPSDGRLAWADDGKQVMAAAPDADGALLVEEGTWPLWSPDGKHLLVWNNSDSETDDDEFLDSFEALLHDADGTPMRSLGQMDARTWHYADTRDFIWSRDGAYVAYITGHIDPETSEEVNEARIEPTDGSMPPVTLASDAIILRWAPDGRHLLYATPAECGDGASRNIWDLRVVAADGSGARRIDTIAFPRWSLVVINPWSPDGKHVAYESIDPQDCSTELRVSSVDGDRDAAPVSIAADVKFLGWSPDSTFLQYGEVTDRPVTDYLLSELSWVVRRDGTSRRFIGEMSPSAYGWIFWSDDGAHISYTEMLRNAEGNVTGLTARTQRADGDGGTTTLAELGNALSWSDDGHAAYVAQHDDDGDGVPDREALYVHTPDSPDGDVELVHALPASTRVAIWSPDGSHLIYASGSIESFIGWIRDRGRGVDVWGIETDQPRWAHRLITDVTWGDWQPESESG